MFSYNNENLSTTTNQNVCWEGWQREQDNFMELGLSL